jgi:hypothetical protein
MAVKYNIHRSQTILVFMISIYKQKCLTQNVQTWLRAILVPTVALSVATLLPNGKVNVYFQGTQIAISRFINTENQW